MAIYNINKIVRLTRIALGMSQEELCYGICSAVTLSRIENGGRVKRKTYRRLMERMGRTTGDRYAVCIGRKGELLDERTELERAFYCQDYENAEYCLHRMREKADDNVLTAQYIARSEALVHYYRKRINEKKMLERVIGALKLTVPEYEKYIGGEKIFPFVKEELQAVMDMGIAYSRMGEAEKCMEAFGTVLRCLEANYIGLPDRLAIWITVWAHIAKLYENREKYEEAIGIIEYCLEMSSEIEYGHMYAILLGTRAYNYGQLAKKRGIHYEEIKGYLRQAYYIAVARNDNVLAQILICNDCN